MSEVAVLWFQRHKNQLLLRSSEHSPADTIPQNCSAGAIGRIAKVATFSSTKVVRARLAKIAKLLAQIELLQQE